MRISRAFLVCSFAAACQTAQQDGTPSPGTGSTSYTRGTPDTMRSDTTLGAASERSQSGATLTLDLTTYSPGATVAMRIRSQTSDTLGFNQCSSRVVERQEGSSWVAHPEPGRMCTMQLQLLMPNDTTTATTDLPQDLRAGSYRIVLSLSRQSASNPGTVRAISPTFRVS
jgi:hypothetical protein